MKHLRNVLFINYIGRGRRDSTGCREREKAEGEGTEEEEEERAAWRRLRVQ